MVENGWNKVTMQTIAKRSNSVIVADARDSLFFFFHAGRSIWTESKQEEAEIFLLLVQKPTSEADFHSFALTATLLQ